MYYLNSEFLLNINNYKNHYFCWLLLGDLYSNSDTLLSENKLPINKQNIAAATCIDKGEKLISFYSTDYSINYIPDENEEIKNNTLIFNRIIKDANEPEKDNIIFVSAPQYIKSNLIALVDIGTNLVSIQDVIENDFNKKIIYYNEIVAPKPINKETYNGFSVGKIKVNLNGLEE